MALWLKWGIFSYFQCGNMTLFEPYARKHYALYTLNLVFEGFEKSTLCSISHEKKINQGHLVAKGSFHKQTILKHSGNQFRPCPSKNPSLPESLCALGQCQAKRLAVWQSLLCPVHLSNPLVFSFGLHCRQACTRVCKGSPAGQAKVFPTPKGCTFPCTNLGP